MCQVIVHWWIPVTLGLLASLAGCNAPARFWIGPSDLRVWAVPEDAVVFPDSPAEVENAVFSDADRLVRLAGAVNEVVAFQVAFRSTRSAEITNLSLDDLTAGPHVIPADRAAFFREARVLVQDYPAWFLRLTPHLRRPRWYPDILIPLAAPRGALPIELTPGQAEAVWVEIRIPPGTPAGRYDSTLTVARHGGGRSTLKVRLNVWPFALPQTRHLAVVAPVRASPLLSQHLEVVGRPYEPGTLGFDDPMYPRATAVLDAAARLLHEHRCGPVLADILPRRRVAPDGQDGLDWTDYDRLVSAVIEGTAFEDRSAAPAWPVPINDRQPAPEAFGGWGSPTYEARLIEEARLCAAHFADRGWLDRHFVYFDVPGDTSGERYHRCERIGQLIQAADRRLHMLCTLPPQSLAPWGWRDDGFRDVSQHVAVWAPPAGLADADSLARQRIAGRRTWLKPDRPPFSGSLSLFAPGDHARSLAWQAWRWGCEAILLDAVNEAAAAENPAGTYETSLIWPGKSYGLEIPVPSIRLKRLRRGLQDYEYLWLLVKNRRPGIARRIAGDLFSFGGSASYGDHFLDGRPEAWTADGTAWSLAHRLIAAEIASAIEAAGTRPANDEAAEVERFDRQIEWARFTDTVRQLRVQVEGVRVQWNPSQSTKPIALEATVTVLNATPDPVGGRLTLPDGPADWRIENPPEPIADLPAYGGVQRRLRLVAEALQPNVDGVLPIRVGVDRGRPKPDVGQGRVALLTSQRLLKPITLDGKLEDWPLGAGNVAGDFVLVGAADVPKQGLPRPDRPTQPTTVFVAHDDEHLYIAFFCQDDQLADRRVARDNFVHYDELWPAGDDLVEVVLDPTAAAASPADLLHIVVKSNGAVVCERGVPALARVAPCTNWPANVAAAVDDRTHSDRWTVEIRIPINSISPHTRVFGANFARFNPRLGEYSSWSAARRYIYSPVSLGNIHLPAQ